MARPLVEATFTGFNKAQASDIKLTPYPLLRVPDGNLYGG